MIQLLYIDFLYIDLSFLLNLLCANLRINFEYFTNIIHCITSIFRPMKNFFLFLLIGMIFLPIYAQKKTKTFDYIFEKPVHLLLSMVSLMRKHGSILMLLTVFLWFYLKIQVKPMNYPKLE